MNVPPMIAFLIVSNPNDLMFSLSEDNELVISRGPGHEFKPLVLAKFDKSDDPFSLIEELLIDSVSKMHKRLSSEEDNSVFRYIYPSEREIEELEILKISDVEEIMKDLKNNRIAKTFKQ